MVVKGGVIDFLAFWRFGGVSLRCSQCCKVC